MGDCLRHYLHGRNLTPVMIIFLAAEAIVVVCLHAALCQIQGRRERTSTIHSRKGRAEHRHPMVWELFKQVEKPSTELYPRECKLRKRFPEQPRPSRECLGTSKAAPFRPGDYPL